AFARRHTRDEPTPWISVDWDSWRPQDAAEQAAMHRLPALELAMTPEECADAFERVLAAAALPQLVISTGDLQVRLDQWINREVHAADSASAESETQSLHPRPRLSTPYVEPGNQIERMVADIWQQLLGIEQIGAHDDFFELGGHSPMATRLVSRLTDMFQVELPLQSLFETPTPASLSAVVAQKLVEQVGDDVV